MWCLIFFSFLCQTYFLYLSGCYSRSISPRLEITPSLAKCSLLTPNQQQEQQQKKPHWILSLQTRLHLSLISLLRWKEPMTIHQAQLWKISNFGLDFISKMSTLLLTMTNLYDIFAYLLKGDWACIWVIFEPFPFSNTPSVFTDFQMHLFPPETMTTMSN